MPSPSALVSHPYGPTPVTRRSAAPETLDASQPLPVPLRCACPTAAQAATGARFLISYLSTSEAFSSLSVYCVEFNGDAVAVEVLNRDLNTIHLVGLCHHHGRCRR